MKVSLDEIKTELKDNTGWLSINRPEAKNAISTKMWQAIPQLIGSLYSDGARSIVIQGTDNCFGSGADLEELQAIDSYKSAFQFWNSIKETLEFIWSLEVPTIAKIDGPCLGGACLLATACDLRFASDMASFAVPTSKFGIVLDDDTVHRIVSLVGPAKAAELLYTGDTITSEQAKLIGLINDCLDTKTLEAKVLAIATQLNKNSFGSIYECKKSIRRAVFQQETSGLTPQHESVAVSSYLTSDFKNRVKGQAQ